MELYRIILVDDEEEVRKSIIRKIDWEEAGFFVAGDAENGEDALEKIEALEPDVVLTDIRMPYMDGLTLAERIRQKYPSMKIVIFSGFDDFEYAKQAIKLNVTEYILKPVNVEELTAILKRIKVNLDQEIEQKRNVNLLRENYIRSLPILRENFLNELVSHSMDPAIVESRMREYDLDLLGAKKWIAAAIDIEEPEKERMGQLAIHQEKDLIPISVMQILEEKLGAYCRFALFNAAGIQESGLSLPPLTGKTARQALLMYWEISVRKPERSWLCLLPSALEIIPPSFAGSAIPIRRRLILWATRPLWGAGAPSISTIWSR